jgi:hypothetical protein
MYKGDGLQVNINCIYVEQALTFKNGWIRGKQSLANRNYHITMGYV